MYVPTAADTIPALYISYVFTEQSKRPEVLFRIVAENK